MKEIVSHPWLDEVMESIRSPLTNLRITGNIRVKEEINNNFNKSSDVTFDESVVMVKHSPKKNIPRKVELSPMKFGKKVDNKSPESNRHNKNMNSNIKGKREESTKLRFKLCKPEELAIDQLDSKNKRNNIISSRKKTIKRIEFGENKKLNTIPIKHNDSYLNQSCASAMQYCLFKRECLDDLILENFCATHLIEFDDYNIAAIREFAELSIESPIDFKSIIKKLQKRQRILK